MDGMTSALLWGVRDVCLRSKALIRWLQLSSKPFGSSGSAIAWEDCGKGTHLRDDEGRTSLQVVRTVVISDYTQNEAGRRSRNMDQAPHRMDPTNPYRTKFVPNTIPKRSIVSLTVVGSASPRIEAGTK